MSDIEILSVKSKVLLQKHHIETIDIQLCVQRSYLFGQQYFLQLLHKNAFDLQGPLISKVILLS